MQESGQKIADEAEKKTGKQLKATERNAGAKGSVVSGRKRRPVKDDKPTLADLGLTKDESADAQLLAGLPATGGAERNERDRFYLADRGPQAQHASRRGGDAGGGPINYRGLVY